MLAAAAGAEVEYGDGWPDTAAVREQITAMGLAFPGPDDADRGLVSVRYWQRHRLPRMYGGRVVSCKVI